MRPDASPVATRWRHLAGAFGDRVRAVPEGAWDDPAPCEGWVARDVVRHLVEWVPALLHAGAGVEVPPGPPVDVDPVGAWATLDGAVQAILDDPGVHDRTFDHPRAGRHALDDAIATFVLGDVFIHTWDLARATGLDETLDAGEAAAMLAGMEPLDEVLRASGQYGPRVAVPDDADVQTRLLAFTGRHP